MICAECGEEMEIDASGIANHVGDGPDGIDHDLDADHVPYSEDYEDGDTEFDTSDPYDIEYDVP